MAKSFYLLIAFFYIVKAFSQQVASEIYFTQDSLLPNKITVYIKILSEINWDSLNRQDSVGILWGDNTVSTIPLTDSTLISGSNPKNYNAIYSGSHIYDSTFMNSYIIIGYSQGSRSPAIANVQAVGGFYVRTVLNMSYLKNIVGYISPHFNASLYLSDTTGQPVVYNPQLESTPTYNTYISLTSPLVNYNQNAAYTPPYVSYSISPDTIFVCDSSSGLFVWNYPYISGLFETAFQITQYSNDTLISIVMQDMVFLVLNYNTGVKAISSNIINIHPIPANGSFIIDMSGYNAGDKQINIYDQLGQVVYQTHTSLDKLQVNDKLSAGLYIVIVTQDAQRAHARVLIE